MAKTVAYYLYSAAIAGTTVNAAQLSIINRGTIVAYDLAFQGSGGIAIGNQLLTVTKNASTSGVGSSNNPQREQIVGIGMVASPNGGNIALNKYCPGIAIPVNPGDVISVGGTLISGTAPASATVGVTLYVQE
jgi:hypothetical protein